jgi:aminopeptidase YwaD
MRLFIFFVLFFLGIPVFNYAQSVERARMYLDTLCSPAMHGRGATFKGDSIAASYLQDRFAEFGLKKFRGKYFQAFSYNINTFPGKVSLKVDSKKLQPGADFILHPASHSGQGEVKLVYLDTTIFADKKRAKKFLKSNLSKRALVLQAKDIKQLSILGFEYIQKITSAACIVELNTKLTASLSGFQYSIPYFQVLTDQFPANINTLTYDVDAELIEKYESQNVLGYISGKVEPDSFVVFTAHYDHLGRLGKDVYFPGANDNGSGISMLLELARFYALPENQPDCSIAFMLFSAEEAGLIGSKHYVDNPVFSLEKIKFLVNMDLLGTGDTGLMVVNGSVFSTQYELLTAINERGGYLPEIKKRGEAANSDHYFFTKAGVPAFFIYTLGGITAYHDVYDIPKTLPFTEFEDIFKLLTDFVSAL